MLYYKIGLFCSKGKLFALASIFCTLGSAIGIYKLSRKIMAFYNRILVRHYLLIQIYMLSSSVLEYTSSESPW